MAKIYRDSFGVPHIDATNYKDAVKAIAFAHCEDDFFTIQTWLLAAYEKSGHYDDWDGPYLDLVCNFFEIRKHAITILQKISYEYLELLQAYAEGVNMYAEKSKKEILVKKIFPISTLDLITVHHLIEILGIQLDKPYSYLKDSSEITLPQRQGSNVIAIGKCKSATGSSLLAISPHQTMEGIFSFYEIHLLLKEEKLELHGFILPCTFTIFMGTNFNIAWGSVASYPEMYNIYKIPKIQHDNKSHYFEIQGKKIFLEKYLYTNITKLYGKVPYPIFKQYYRSEFGNIIKINNEWYLLDIPMLGSQLRMENNYYLSLTRSCKEARSLFERSRYTYLDFTLIDKFDNLLFIHNSKEKIRENQEYHYQNVLPAELIGEIKNKDYYETDNMITLENPSCNYIISVNQSPFKITDKNTFDHRYKGLVYVRDNSRFKRAKELIESHPTISINDLKVILYDTKIIFPIIRNIDFSIIFTMNEKKYPSLENLISSLRNWDGTATVESHPAAIFALMFHRYKEYYRYSKNPDVIKEATEKEIVDCLRWTKKHIDDKMTLGDIQFISRGKIRIPICGIPDSLNTVRSYYDRGKLFAEECSAFRMIIDIKNHTSLTCHPLGSSSNEDDENYTNQMQLFIDNRYRELLPVKEYINKYKSYTI